MSTTTLAQVTEATTERDQLRAEVERLTAERNRLRDVKWEGIHALEQRAERAEAELAKLRGFYSEIVAECGHDLIVREYRQRGELLRQEVNRRKDAEAERATMQEDAP